MIIASKEKGYYATEDGKVFKPNGKEVKGSPLKLSGHLRITLYADGINDHGYCSVLKHRFIAYFFLGEEVFSYPLIRHKNDISNDNRLQNLVPGSFKENRADIPRWKLSKIAKDQSPALIERCRKLSNEEVKSMRVEYSKGDLSYKALSEIYGVSTMTAYRAVNKQSWKDI